MRQKKEYKNPFLDERPIPEVAIKFRTILDTKDADKITTWTSFISKVMREEKSKYKYSQIGLIRKFLKESSGSFDFNEMAEYAAKHMCEPLKDIIPLLYLIDDDTLSYVLAISGFNIREYLRANAKMN